MEQYVWVEGAWGISSEASWAVGLDRISRLKLKQKKTCGKQLRYFNWISFPI